MRGTVYVIYPDNTIAVMRLPKPPTAEDMCAWIKSTLNEVVPHFNHFRNENGQLVRATVIVDQEGLHNRKDFNFIATAVWHFVAKAQGLKITQHLHGNVLVCTGDDEFMDALLD